MAIWPFTLELRRRWRLRRAPPGPLYDYLATPFPKPSADYRAADFLAVDLETSGLDAKTDLILSVGYVTLRGGGFIDLSTARHRLVQPDRAIPEASAVIHRITDDEAAQGEELAAVLEDLLAALAGKVLIAHHARVETGFIAAACRRVYGGEPLAPVVDTQALAQRTFERRQSSFKGSDLRLHALTARYNLPRYGAHNALSDALAAGQLFLAQAAHQSGGRGARLRDFLCN
jgi:DNA polymerase III subunit epsilon